MSKKSFTSGLNSLLGEQAEKPKPGRPATQKKEVVSSAERGTLENETRATFIINKDTLRKIKMIAWYDRVLHKDVINEALERYITDWEIENKTTLIKIEKLKNKI